MHLKRQEAPKIWPITRKGTKYVVRPNSNLNGGIPLLVIIRDILKNAQNRKEVKRAIHEKNILINQKKIKDEKVGVLLFDKITLVPNKKYYELNLSELGRFKLIEIKETESHTKIVKITNKKILKGKKVQLNLSDGRNIISEIEGSINDSVIIEFKSKKIIKIIPLKEKTKVFIFSGKHAGKKGIIEKIDKDKKIAEISVDKDKINVLIKQIMAIE